MTIALWPTLELRATECQDVLLSRPALRGPDNRLTRSGRLADTIDERFRLLVLLRGYCGLRWGEAAGLTTDRVDLLHGRIVIDQASVEVLG